MSLLWCNFMCKECTQKPVGEVGARRSRPLNDFISIAGRDLGFLTERRHVPCDGRGMNSSIESLATLQELTSRASKPATKAQQATISQLRATFPVPVLVYFDRRVTCGHQAVAEVRNGVCMSCHLRLPVGTVAGLGASGQLVTCESCGSYLRLAPDVSSVSNEANSGLRVTGRRMVKSVKSVSLIESRGHRTTEIIHATSETLVPV